VAITQFDCSKSEEYDANATPAAVPGLSTWMAGGPGGATWNATDLTCFGKLQTSCEVGFRTPATCASLLPTSEHTRISAGAHRVQAGVRAECAAAGRDRAWSGQPGWVLLDVPALYLVWVLVVDLSCLLRSGFRASGSYRARPHYWLWVVGAILPVLGWLA
jgi:hypothetical protein